jgi:hypothetical protein
LPKEWTFLEKVLNSQGGTSPTHPHNTGYVSWLSRRASAGFPTSTSLATLCIAQPLFGHPVHRIGNFAIIEPRLVERMDHLLQCTPELVPLGAEFGDLLFTAVQPY